MLPVAHTINFDGALLCRGFWIYAWKITAAQRTVYYVGRTGDSSSNNAGSPFNRMGAHLDAHPNAKANSLTRRLRETGLEPEACDFRMAAVGPLFPEQVDFGSHKPIRDVMATLEHKVAATFRELGNDVLGVHSCAAVVETALASHVVQELLRALADSDA